MENKTEWQPIEKLTQEHGQVLLCFGSPFFGTFTQTIETGCLDDGRYLFWLDSREISTNGVTHWMPLPELPEESKS